jgi:thioredoxin
MFGLPFVYFIAEARMATVALTAENFNQYVDRDGMLVIDWWAPWCGPCRAFGPIYDKASDTYADITFGKVNTEDQPDLAGAFQIQAIPTLMVFRDRVLLFANPGMISAAALDELLGKVRALDMDDIRKKIAEQERAEQERAEARPGDDVPGEESDTGSRGAAAAESQQAGPEAGQAGAPAGDHAGNGAGRLPPSDE